MTKLSKKSYTKIKLIKKSYFFLLFRRQTDKSTNFGFPVILEKQIGFFCMKKVEGRVEFF